MTMFKHYIPKAILLTVRFTGTHFTRSLLAHLGNVYIPNAHWLDQEVKDEWEKIKLRKVIVTVRDPRLSAIRAIKSRSPSAVEDIANEWINKWAPENFSTHDAKVKYLESGELPEGHNWDALQPAIDWYNSLTTRA